MQAVDEVPAILGLWRQNQYFAPFSAKRQATRNRHIEATVIG